MSDPLAIALSLPFQEQIDFFRQKLNLPTARWDDIWKGAHDRAFIVTGAMKADLLDDLRSAVAPLQGGTLEHFRKSFKGIVQRHGWHGWTGEGTAKGEAWRTRVIFETNIRSSFAAGRYRQLTDPDLIKALPYWRYIHNDSATHPRPLHKQWGDMRLTLRHDDPFWQTHYPPNGWGCRCRVVPVRGPIGTDATTPPAGWDAIDPKTGEQVGIDKGWGYAPGASVSSAFSDLIGQKLIRLDAGIGAAMMQTLAPALAAEQTAAFGGFVEESLANPPRGKLFVAGALKPGWVEAAEKAGIRPETAEIAVRDEDVRHSFRPAKHAPLDLAWYKELPRHLGHPDAVLLDTTHTDEPAFLLLYSMPDTAAKLVVRVNYQVKKAGVFNVVETGKALGTKEIASIRGQIGKGYLLVEGGL